MVSPTSRPLDAASEAASELAERAIRLDRVHAPQERPAHVALCRNDLLGARDHFLCDRLRYDDYAVAVAEQVIAGRDGYGADRDPLSEGVGDPTLDNIGGRQKRAEHREALSEHELGIPRAAVDDVAQYAARLKRL